MSKFAKQVFIAKVALDNFGLHCIRAIKIVKFLVFQNWEIKT
jgi:hypothetical protein